MKDKKIIAVDFDGTLFECSTNYPQLGNPRMETINKCKELQQNKDYELILWTCRTDADLEVALKALAELDLKFEWVNENPTWAIERWGNDCRKVGATWYLDDKNLSSKEFLKL